MGVRTDRFRWFPLTRQVVWNQIWLLVPQILYLYNRKVYPMASKVLPALTSDNKKLCCVRQQMACLSGFPRAFSRWGGLTLAAASSEPQACRGLRMLPGPDEPSCPSRREYARPQKAFRGPQRQGSQDKH